MTEHEQKTDLYGCLSACNAQADNAKRLFRHTQEPVFYSRLRRWPTRNIVLAMYLFVGFMWACKPTKEVSNPLSREVENVVFESEQMENGSVPTDMKITMAKEVNAVRVSHSYHPKDFKPINPDSIQAKRVTITEEALGSGKHWSVKIDSLQLEKQVSSGVTLHLDTSSGIKLKILSATDNDSVFSSKDGIVSVIASVEITIEWTNKDGTNDKIEGIPVGVEVEEKEKNDGTIERKVVSVSLEGERLK